MEYRKLALPVVVAIVVMLVGAAIHATLTDRFGPVQSERLVEFTANLSRVPQSFGPWRGVDAEVDADQLARAQVAGHVSRSYRHEATGEVVNFFLVAGTSRHITLHTPDLCYQSAGFAMESEPVSHAVDVGLSQPVELATSRFYREENEGPISQVRIFWTFSDDGVWRGPRWARSALAGKGAIYKIYFISPTAEPVNGPLTDSAPLRFVKQAMPELQRVLFPAESPDWAR